MKKCSKCEKIKSLDEFQKRSRNKDGYTNMCKICKRDYDNSHYAKNSYRREYIRKNRKRALEESRDYVCEYLATHPCIDCGESDIVVLDFDHVSDNKRSDISRLIRSSLNAVKLEIEKCEVRCANCHRRKTAKQFNWYKLSYSAL